MGTRTRALLSLLRSAVIHWPLTVLCTLLLEPVSLAAALLDRSGRIQHRIVAFWSGLLLRLYGMSVTVTGLERLDVSRPRIFAANHLSALDIPCSTDICHSSFASSPTAWSSGYRSWGGTCGRRGNS